MQILLVPALAAALFAAALFAAALFAAALPAEAGAPLADGADKCVTDLKLTTDAGASFVRQVNFCQSRNFTYHGR